MKRRLGPALLALATAIACAPALPQDTAKDHKYDIPGSVILNTGARYDGVINMFVKDNMGAPTKCNYIAGYDDADRVVGYYLDTLARIDFTELGYKATLTPRATRGRKVVWAWPSDAACRRNHDPNVTCWIVGVGRRGGAPTTCDGRQVRYVRFD
jgi:hypothetical protein